MSQISILTTASSCLTSPDRATSVRDRVMKVDIIMLTNYLRMIVFSYFSTHELLTKVSVMNQATRKQLLNRGGSYGVVASVGAPAPMF